jgi:hypothetical protein
MNRQHTTGEMIVCSVMVMLVTGFLTFGVTSKFYEKQLDRLAANPLCAAACNVLKAVKRK